MVWSSTSILTLVSMLGEEAMVEWLAVCVATCAQAQGYEAK